eukprot:CAMPEP_0182898036 /NCGR_PEP_ID=MMETSP0034_2-20130328/27249_1 /TAXON_ID=156128 /ORGANISM="Nephroselmis pyriformis, Strain CCMP717" /LENGTH=46 /DNA_ID= /DNA_START= /DNA_END= /DNA_ORIENTATION=
MCWRRMSSRRASYAASREPPCWAAAADLAGGGVERSPSKREHSAPA